MMKLLRDERGVTLIELVIAIAIASAIAGVITMSIFQVFSINTRSSNHMVAVRQVQQAGKDVSEDVLQARVVQLDPDGECSLPWALMTLTWTDWDGPTHTIVYTITDEHQLLRTHSIDDNGMVSETSRIVATHIVCDETSVARHGTRLVFTVTSRVGGHSETRVYEITRRIR